MRIQKQNNYRGSYYEISAKLFAEDNKWYSGRLLWPAFREVLQAGNIAYCKSAGNPRLVWVKYKVSGSIPQFWLSICLEQFKSIYCLVAFHFFFLPSFSSQCISNTHCFWTYISWEILKCCLFLFQNGMLTKPLNVGSSQEVQRSSGLISMVVIPQNTSGLKCFLELELNIKYQKCNAKAQKRFWKLESFWL